MTVTEGPGMGWCVVEIGRLGMVVVQGGVGCGMGVY